MNVLVPALGGLPHVLLMAFLILQLIVNGDPEARSFMGLLVIPELAIVPVGVLVGGVCMIEPYARAFGRGALSSTLIGATLQATSSTTMEVGMLVHYEPDEVDTIASAASRQYLIDVGLPGDHLLFRPHRPAVPITSHSKIQAVAIGEIRSATICVNAATGSIFTNGTYGKSEWHVNASVERFAESLAEFTRRYPFYEYRPDLDTCFAAADAFEAAVRVIDPSAFTTPNTYWRGIIGDVSNGDYGERAIDDD